MKDIFLTIVLLLLCFDVIACQPAVPADNSSLRDQVKNSFEESDFVGLVYVEEIQEGDGYPELNITFRVLESFKGTETSFSTGWYARCCLCQKHFEQGKAYVIYANQPDEELSFWFINEFGLSKEISALTSKELGYLRGQSK